MTWHGIPFNTMKMRPYLFGSIGPILVGLFRGGAVGAQIKLVSLLVTRGGTLETGTYACRQQYNQRDTVIEFNSVTQYHCAADVMAIWRIALRGSRS
jgi:hypothetical protein